MKEGKREVWKEEQATKQNKIKKILRKKGKRREGERDFRRECGWINSEKSLI